MKVKLIILGILSCLFAVTASAQENLIYNHYYLNPFLYNPSMIAPNGYSELYLNYRKQWSGIEGAPETKTLNLHLPLSYKSGLAFTAYNDQAGLLKTTTGMISFAYQIYLGKSITDLHKIGFGISAGVTNSRIDATEDIQDPVLGNNNTSSLDGQFGIHYQYNKFRVGLALPRLFETRVASTDQFSKPGITQINSIITSMGYEFRIGTGFAIEPIVTYRTYHNLDPQFEFLTNFKIGKAAWVGGSYRQDYGAVGFLGFNIKEKVKIAYAYEIATEQSDRLGNGTHEVQLVLRLGKKKFTRPTAVSKATPHATTPNPVHEKPVEAAEAETPTAETPAPVTETPAVQTETKPVITEPTKQPVKQTPLPEQVTPEVAQKPVTRLDGEEVAPGHYVVVGAFQSVANAKTYQATLKRAGYPASVAYHPEKRYYIVHMIQAPTLDEARVLRDKYRQMSRYSFRDTWILSIE